MSNYGYGDYDPKSLTDHVVLSRRMLDQVVGFGEPIALDLPGRAMTEVVCPLPDEPEEASYLVPNVVLAVIVVAFFAFIALALTY